MKWLGYVAYLKEVKTADNSAGKLKGSPPFGRICWRRGKNINKHGSGPRPVAGSDEDGNELLDFNQLVHHYQLLELVSWLVCL
jgi:hypothetical protein